MSMLLCFRGLSQLSDSSSRIILFEFLHDGTVVHTIEAPP